jgi:hypothetical protein
MGKRLLKLPRRLLGYQPASVDQLIADRDSMLGVAEQRVRSAEARIAELEEELSRRGEDLEAVKSQAGPERGGSPGESHSVHEGADEVAMERVVHAADDAGEMAEWPLPPVRSRTVEFIPPPEPSASFDPMPIGEEDRDWGSPAVSSVDEESWPSASEATDDAEESWLSASEATDEPEELAPQITPAYMSDELANVVKAAEESATKIIERAWESTRSQISQVDRLWRDVQAEIIRFAAWRQHVDPMLSTVQGYIEEARARIEEVPPRIQEALSPAIEAITRVDDGMSEFAKASDLPDILGRLHAEVAKAVDTGDFTASSSGTSPSGDVAFEAAREKDEGGIEAAEGAGEDEGPDEQHAESADDEKDHQAQADGRFRPEETEDIDMASAIVHELRIINESGETSDPPAREA